MDAVGTILAEKEQERVSWAPATVLTFLLHVAVLGAFLASTIAKPIRYSAPRAVAVRLLPAGAIRVPQPAPVPAEPAPPPAAPKPKIEKPPPKEAPKPSEKAVLLPAKDDKKKKPT